MASVTIQQMKDYISKNSSLKFRERLENMPDSQIVAVYHSFLRRKK